MANIEWEKDRRQLLDNLFLVCYKKNTINTYDIRRLLSSFLIQNEPPVKKVDYTEETPYSIQGYVEKGGKYISYQRRKWVIKKDDASSLSTTSSEEKEEEEEVEC